MTGPAVSLDDRRRSRDDRLLPHDLEAEESLLGAMLLSRDAIGAVGETPLGPGDFYKPAHGDVFEAITALYAQGEPVDPTTVADLLRRRGRLDAIGGPAVLVSLQAGTPSTGSAGRYARIVADHATLRRMVAAGGEIAELGHALPVDVEGALDAAEAKVYALRPTRDVPTARSLREHLPGWLDHIDVLAAAGGVPEHPTGLRDLDEVIGGLHPAQLVIVAGRPGSGKTSLAGQLAANVARRGGPTLFVSIEMAAQELVGRFVASEAGLDGSRISRGRIAPKDWERINPAVGRLAELPVEIVDIATATLSSIRTAARRAVSRYGYLETVVVDYVQLMSGAGRRYENRQVEVAEVARGLKVIAKDLGVAVVAMAQLRRDVDLRSNKRPVLADLRESGELEQSGDVVVFVYRDEMYNDDSPDVGVAELIVGKNRHGPCDTVRVAADMRTGRWSDLARRDDL